MATTANQWLSGFKSALVANDEDRILALTDDYPDEMELGEIEETMALLKEAMELFRRKQIALRAELDKAKKAKQYSF